MNTQKNPEFNAQETSEFFIAKALEIRGGNIIALLNDVFHLLSTRTNFYHESGNGGPGYPPGIAQKIVYEIFQTYNPTPRTHDNIFLPTVVAEEIEVTTSEDVDSFTVDIDESNAQPNETSLPSIESKEEIAPSIEHIGIESLNINDEPFLAICPEKKLDNETEEIKEITVMEKSECTSGSMQKNKKEISESYNGAIRDNYCWSQSICELDVTVPLPAGVKSKQLDVNVTGESIRVRYKPINSEWVTLIDDKLTCKIKPSETLWTLSEGRIKIHLEKQIEKWWHSLVINEPKIDTTELNCSRPLHELSEEHLAKIEEVQWNHKQKLAGLPTSDEIEKAEILKRAWNLPGSPFANTPYDPNIIAP